MSHRRRLLLAISASAALVTSTGLVTASVSSAAPPPAATQARQGYAGSFAISGKDAAAYVVPDDLHRLWSNRLPDGTTQTRYQQTLGKASVFGGQVTVLRDAAGTPTSVIGAYFPDLRARNAVKLDKAQARGVVEKRIGDRGSFRNALHIDPRTGRYFYEVQSLRAAQRPVRWVDAATGAVTNSFNGLTEGTGVGVKGDTKTIDTTRNASTGLFELKTGDDRQETYDLLNKPTTAGGTLMTDPDDVWNNTKGTTSPSQPAGVDAHYYAGIVDDFYRDTFARNSLDDNGLRIVSKVHYDRHYCNAFWNGAFMTYGDGDGKSCLPLSGGLDVDGHEMTHGVTEFTSNLIYENESGALNESFSDMMGNTMEFYAAERGLDPAAQPDWRIGEDVINPGTPGAGFRNMGDPQEFQDPSHYSQKFTGTADNGGVHTNSGISNHAYYLTVNGGRNASCSANVSHGVLLTGPDCDVVVPALGLATAQQIFYKGFTSLPEYANFCDARNATIAAAGGANGKAITAAWDAVGVHAGCAPGTPPPPPCTSNPNAQIPFESPHPYGNNADCTWTYDNGSAGFQLHFSQLETEKDFDFVNVKDASGSTLATYTGRKNAFWAPCIPTSTGSVQLTSDSGVTAPGFTVDAVRAC
ncbi:MAG: peptidase M4 [Nocardioidaceae bacterium]|nr:peptidase M4 [Nocardioidaceae bacterium]